MKQTLIILSVLATVHVAFSLCGSPNCGAGCICGAGVGPYNGNAGVVGGLGNDIGGLGGIIGGPGALGGVAGGAGAVVQTVVRPARIIVQEAPQIIPDYSVGGAATVVQQESAPRFVFGDVTPVRFSHRSRTAVIENFETPYIIDAVQRSTFINHASQPVVIDHYDHPEVVSGEGIPVIYETVYGCGTEGCGCICGVPNCQ